MIAASHLLLFFFYAYGAPRDLHSFPTRRSSDLAHTGAGERAPLRHGAPAPHHPRRLQRAVVRDLRLDRKSTRLNSSHTVISYAVFCLKKKTNGSTTPTPSAAAAYAKSYPNATKS